jgi:hypothetical protein
MEDLVRERVELKYLLLPEEAREVRRLLQALSSRPGFKEDYGWVTTVYLDRPDGSLARRALGSPWKSLKIRLREYFTPEGAPLSPFVFLEVKERAGPASRKSRVRVHKRRVASILRGGPHLEELPDGPPAPGERGSLREVLARVREAGAGPLRPMGAARYRRLALEGGWPRARLTLDQEITYHPAPLGLYETHAALGPGALGPPAIEEETGVLELKQAGTRPAAWCAETVGERWPAEYSKFRVLAALSASETLAGASRGTGFEGMDRTGRRNP